jgi:hypothetical protein
VKLPKPLPETVRLFETLVADDPRLEVRKLFGQPCAFANGNMCLGVLGADIFLRLSEADRLSARNIPGTRPFEPIVGRPLSEYLVFPLDVLRESTQSRLWVKRCLTYALGLPPKRPKRRR